MLSKDVEFSGDLSLSTVKVNAMNAIGCNNTVCNGASLAEFLCFQVSDNTVRVPNTRSF